MRRRFLPATTTAPPSLLRRDEDVRCLWEEDGRPAAGARRLSLSVVLRVGRT